MPKYKWDSKKWENDDEWWNPYNPKGRLKGKGTTSWARQLRRQAMQPDAQQPLEKEAEKQQELAEGKPAELPQPLEKRQKDGNQQPNKPLEKWQKKTDQALEKKAEASEKQGEKKDENKTSGKDDKKKQKNT